MGVKIHPLFKDIYPNEELTFELFQNLMKQLSLGDTIIWCARLNWLLTCLRPETDVEIQQDLILRFLRPQDIDNLNNVVKKHGGSQSVSFFFRYQLLQLIRWAALLCENKQNDGETFNDQTVRNTFAKCALIAAEIWQHDNYSKVSPRPISPNRKEFCKEMLQSFRTGTAAGAHLSHPMTYIPKGNAIICDILPQIYPSFPSDFAETGITLEEYYSCAITIAAINNDVSLKTAFNANRSGIFNINNAPKDKPFFSKFSKYLELEGQSASDLRKAFWGEMTIEQVLESTESFNAKPLRTKTIFVADDGRSIIIDPIFFADKFGSGPIFVLPEEKRDIAFSKYGMAYNQYVNKSLESILENAKLDSKDNLFFECKPADNQGVPIDAIITSKFKKKDVVVIETKSSRINELLPDYVEELEKKYIEGKRRVGVGQLADWISSLSSQARPPSILNIETIDRVFPILLVSDPGLLALPHPEYLAIRFKEELNPEYSLSNGFMRKGNILIAPLIIITVNLFELMGQLFDKFSLVQVLEDYSRSHPDRILPINNFLALETKYDFNEDARLLREPFENLVDEAREVVTSWLK